MWSSWKKFWTIDDLQSRGVRLVFHGVVEGLRSLGKDVRVFPLDTSHVHYQQQLCDDLLTYQPDVVWLANYPVARFLRQMGLDASPFQCLTWCLDDPGLMGKQEFEDHEIVLVADPSFIPNARQRGAKHLFFVPVAAPETVDAASQPEYDHPIAYVGSIYTSSKARQQIRPDQMKFVREIIQYKVEHPETSFEDIFSLMIPGSDSNRFLSPEMKYLLYCEANRIYRFRFLQSLTSLGLGLYGSESWQDACQGSKLESCYRAALDPFTEYPRLISSVKVNLNLRSLQGFTAPTHRDFLVPRWGGFLLSSRIHEPPCAGRTADPTNRFHLDEFPWSPSASTPQSLKESAETYIQNDSLRIDWIQQASEKIAERHTYAVRMEQVGNILDEWNRKLENKSPLEE